MAANDKNMEADKKVSVDGDEIERENEDNQPIDQTKKFESSIALTSEEAVEYKQLEKETQQQHMPHDLILEQNPPLAVGYKDNKKQHQQHRPLIRKRHRFDQETKNEEDEKSEDREEEEEEEEEEDDYCMIYLSASPFKRIKTEPHRPKAGPHPELESNKKKNLQDQETKDKEDREEEEDHGRLYSSASPFKRIKTVPDRPKAGPHPELESNKKNNSLTKLRSCLPGFSKFPKLLKNKTTSEELEDF